MILFWIFTSLFQEELIQLNHIFSGQVGSTDQLDKWDDLSLDIQSHIQSYLLDIQSYQK